MYASFKKKIYERLAMYFVNHFCVHQGPISLYLGEAISLNYVFTVEFLEVTSLELVGIKKLNMFFICFRSDEILILIYYQQNIESFK